MTDRQLFLLMEGEAIRSLLSGNDTQCFTTEQYSESFDKTMESFFGPRPDTLGKPPLEVRRKQLLALAPRVVEVQPDVWVFRPEE